ncbi:asparagine synthetase B family protein [Emticicia fluvialis]|uniref:asparagine synthetase B family protein n=1 Tax=Emticicia fluvialis TaxID=2974474 RepID=UPI0021656A40|nr:asparagine synthase-related protein [Emticicia fluvialis]
MSHYWGCISLSSDFDATGIYHQMQKSMEFFKADAHVDYQSAEAVLANDIVFITPESVGQTQLCRNERYVLVATCRLDNRPELAQKLGLSETLTDYTYLLEAYIKFGKDCVKHIVGDFSFVVWDTHTRTLFMAKDQLGIRPLFYYQDAEKLVFSTTMQAIKAVITPVLNQRYIAIELKNYVQDYAPTFFENIHRFLPAHYALADTTRGVYETARYWELEAEDISGFRNEAELYTELNRRFTEAVVCRARTHKNVGCQLSGGLDSSAIAVLLSRNIPKQRLHTYSFVLSDKTRPYSERGIDEQGTQQAIIDYAGLLPQNHHKIEDFYFKDVYEQLERTDLVMGGFANSDCLWQDSLFKTASADNVGVMMSGFPGDEGVSCSGSNYYYDYFGNFDIPAIIRFFMKYPLRGPKRMLDYLRARWRGSLVKGYDKIQQGRNLLRADSPWHQQLKDESFLFYPTFKKWFKEQITRPHTCHRTESEGAYALTHGMETVYPMADIRLVRLAYSLPVEMFAPATYNRALFRNMCKDILPDAVRLQPKFSGAMTLAFAEYWKKKNIEDLKTYQVTDPLQMMLPDKRLAPDADLMDMLMRLNYYYIDYFVNKYMPAKAN